MKGKPTVFANSLLKRGHSTFTCYASTGRDMKATSILAQACQLAYDLKLHREPRSMPGTEGVVGDHDVLTTQMNRRVFWLAYATDV
jgi:hypothetical protein